MVDEISACEMVKGSFAAIVAPSFTDEAKNILAQNPKIKLVPSAKVESSELDGKLINGGILVQQKDNTLFSHWNIMTKIYVKQLQLVMSIYHLMDTIIMVKTPQKQKGWKLRVTTFLIVTWTLRRMIMRQSH